MTYGNKDNVCARYDAQIVYSWKGLLLICHVRNLDSSSNTVQVWNEIRCSTERDLPTHRNKQKSDNSARQMSELLDGRCMGRTQLQREFSIVLHEVFK